MTTPAIDQLQISNCLRLPDVFIRPEYILFIRWRLGLFDNTRACRKVDGLLPSRWARGSPRRHGIAYHVARKIKNALVQFSAEAVAAPGSQCFLVDGRVVSGYTMCIEACGPVDFPGGNAEQMYYSLTQKLMALPNETILVPGHNYAPLKHATIGEQKKTNPYLKFGSLKQFLAVMGPR